MAKRDQLGALPATKDAQNPTMFGPPVVAPGLTGDPVAEKYRQGFAARHPLKYGIPVAGGPSPTMPRLDAEAVSGMPMSDQANVQRAAEAPPPPGPALPTGGMFGGPAPAPRQGPLPQQQQSQRPPILPSDLLPDEAKNDPEFRGGSGSMYAASQPGLAMKYGVVRSGRKLMPQQLGMAKAGLSSKSLEDLKTLSELRHAQGPAPSPLPAPTPSPEPKTSEEKVEALKQEQKLDDFDFATLRELITKDELNNDDQREAIEARCQEMDLSDLIMRGFATQIVPIIPNKFWPEFQSVPGLEDLALKRLLMEEANKVTISDRYYTDKFSLMAVAAGVRSINGNALPDHHNERGEFDDDKFWVKFNLIARYPFHMLASLSVNQHWFEKRVKKLFVTETIKNG